MKRSILIAATIAILATGWILSGQMGKDSPPSAEAPNAGTEQRAEKDLPQVRVAGMVAEQHRTRLSLFGRTEADRQVEIKAETSGRIREILVEEGALVAPGAVFARIALEDRPARLRSSESLVKQRELEYEASVKLSEKSFRSQTQLAEAEANLQTARADLAQIREDLSHTNLRAPFEGILQSRAIEVGDFVTQGSVVGTIVDLSPIVVAIQVSENRISQIEPGSPAVARLLDGRQVQGVVTFVSAVSDNTARTFKVEIELPNEDRSIPVGMTTGLYLPLETSMAHLVSPSILTLDDDGRIGIKSVDAANRVAFHEVELLEDTPDGVWVSGLPETVTVITVGQEYVTPGVEVLPVEAESDAPGGRIVAMEGTTE